MASWLEYEYDPDAENPQTWIEVYQEILDAFIDGDAEYIDLRSGTFHWIGTIQDFFEYYPEFEEIFESEFGTSFQVNRIWG